MLVLVVKTWMRELRLWLDRNSGSEIDRNRDKGKERKKKKKRKRDRLVDSMIKISN